jgi:hypothetical protein
MIELFAQLSAATVAEAVAFDERRKSFPPSRATPTRASHEMVQDFIAAELASSSNTNCVSMLLIEVAANAASLHYERLMKGTLQTIARELRRADVIFQCSDTELMVIVSGFSRESANDTAARIARRLQEKTIPSHATGTAVTVAVATAPDDGLSVLALVAAARLRASPFHDSNNLSIH